MAWEGTTCREFSPAEETPTKGDDSLPGGRKVCGTCLETCMRKGKSGLMGNKAGERV